MKWVGLDNRIWHGKGSGCVKLKSNMDRGKRMTWIEMMGNRKTKGSKNKQEEDHIDAFIREVENANILVHHPKSKSETHEMCNFYETDDVYCQIGAYISPAPRKKIELGAYVNLPKLLKRIKLSDGDQNFQMVNKEGKMFFIPTTENTNINCFDQWHGAFRIYLGIFSKANPHRAVEIW